MDSVHARCRRGCHGEESQEIRGKVYMPPFDVPTVGRIAVLADPQGATFGIIPPKM